VDALTRRRTNYGFATMGELRASVTTDNSGWFKAVSPAFLELIDGPVESLAGVNLVDLVHPLDAPTMRQLLAHVPVSGAPASFTARVLAAGDVWRPCSVDARPADNDRITVEFTTAIEPNVPPVSTAEIAPAFAAETSQTAEFTGADEPPAVAAAATGSLAPTAAAAETAATTAPAVAVWAVDSALSFEDVLDAPEGSLASDQVPDQRVAARGQFEAVPVLEIDGHGRTTFATGPWAELSETDNHGAAAFEELLERTRTADQVLDLVGTVIATGVARQVEAPQLTGSRWIQIVPIPSPHRADQRHALVAVTRSKADGERVAGPTPTPSAVANSAAAVAPAAAVADSKGEAPDAAAGGSQAEPAATAVAAEADPEGSAPAAAEEVSAGEHDSDTHDLTEAPSKNRRGFFGWLLIGIAGLLAVVVISKLWPSSDGSADTGPIDVTISPADAVEVGPGQSWRPTGVANVGESHGIAVTGSGSAYVAGVNGTVVRLDADAGAVGAVSLGGEETTFVSDIVADDSGTVWALDAGEGRLFRISGDDSVVQVATDPLPLRNARGIGMSSDGAAWIASTASAQLVKIAADGAVTNSVPLPGRQASDVVEAPDGTLWIVDAQELELVQLSVTGEILATVSDDLLGFTSPTSPHLTIVEDSLWVTDPEQSAVFEVDLTTGEMMGERIVLSRPGDTRINKPIGIASDTAGRLWITDSTGAATTILDR